MVEYIIALLVGAAVFIVGMNMMSSGLKKSTGKGVKNLLKKTQNNRFAGMGIGAAITALIQSSAATSIMAIGFISAGVMTMFQGVSVILGAYIGTTVTGVLVSLSSLNFSKYFVLLAVVGVIMMFFKNEKVKSIGEILGGLGLLFFGLSTMSSSFKTNEGPTELLNTFQTAFNAIEKVPVNPLFFLAIGAVLTACLQSSSATSGIVIVMVGSGAIQLSSGFYLVLGATIGTVITTLIASIGGNANVKRTALIALFIRVICAVLALAIVWPIESTIHGVSWLFLTIFKSNQLALAMFLVFYNIIFMFLVLPFLKPIIKLFEKIIKDKQSESMQSSIKYIDDRLLNTPSVAMMQVKREIINMMELARNNFVVAYNRIMNQDNSKDKLIIETEDKVDFINNQITSYLINLSNKVDLKDEKIIGSYFHVINDIERIGDHAYNFFETSIKMKENDLIFSQQAKSELEEMNGIISNMFDLAFKIFETEEIADLHKLHELEDQTDKLKQTLSAAHYERITQNKCKMELSPFYSTFLSELERVADHLVNIGYSIITPTGDAEEDKQTA